MKLEIIGNSEQVWYNSGMNEHYKINEFAKMINVSIKTLQRWDCGGTLKAFRTPTNRRYYTHSQYLEYVGDSPTGRIKGKTVIYTRVSSRNQKDDLKNQVEFLKQYANAKGIIVDLVLDEIGSGLNYNRKKWNELVTMCQKGEIKQIFIVHKDRFIRFGYNWFEDFLKSFGVEIIVVNNEGLSPKQELVKDLISITYVFSRRINGLRKYKRALREDGGLCYKNISQKIEKKLKRE
jgi:putative resolvase